MVKKPIDLTMIQTRVDNGGYHHIDQLLDDLTLMTDNAVSFFSPESEQYQHALILHRAVMKKYTYLKGVCLGGGG